MIKLIKTKTEEQNTMALPRPGAVRPVSEASAPQSTDLPELTRAAEAAPQLGAAQPLGAAREEDPAPPLGTPFAANAAAERAFPASVPTTVIDQEDDAPEAQVIDQPLAPLYDTANNMPAVTSPGGAMAAANVSAEKILEDMGFKDLDLGLGFGAFPTVILKDDEFRTSEGDKLGNTFACVLHEGVGKWIVKASTDKDAEFKYTYDKVNDAQGRPLEATYNLWKAQGKMTGQPFFKPYMDVTAQMFDPTNNELGAIVILQIPETSIEKVKGHLKTLVLSRINPKDVITQVYLGKQVTSTKHPFWPWAFKKWAMLADVGL